MGLASKAKLMGTPGAGGQPPPSAPPINGTGASGQAPQVTPPGTPPQPSGAPLPGQQSQYGGQAAYPSLQPQQSFGGQSTPGMLSPQQSFGGQSTPGMLSPQSSFGAGGAYPVLNHQPAYPQANYGAPQQAQQAQQPPYGQQQQSYYQQPQQQQQPYGQQAQHQAYPQAQAPSQLGGVPPELRLPGGGPPAQQNALRNKLQSIIATNQLQHFYPPARLEALVAQINNINFQKIAEQWRMPLEMAYDLSALALYDIVIFADDSGSMVFEENGERIDDLKLILGKVASVATLFDQDGIVVRFMNSAVQGNGIRDSLSATQLVQQVHFTGLTPLGTKLTEKVLAPFLFGGLQNRDLERPIMVVVITDGEPVGEPKEATAQAIKQAKQAVANSPYGPGAVAFQFAQVGKDQKAQNFLAQLDNDPVIGRMIDATSYYELEAEEYARKGVTLTPELWLVKLMVGAIDPTYDEQD